MRYGQIRKMDIANGPGIRTSVFVTGCTHHCYNCFNEEYQNPEFGTLWTDKETDQVISYLKEPTISGLTLLGGRTDAEYGRAYSRNSEGERSG